MASAWCIGRIDQIVRGRDGKIRKVLVKYTNANENFSRVTERSARSLIRLWSIDDPDLSEDLKKIQDRVDELVGGDDRTGLLVTDSLAGSSQDAIVLVGVELIKPESDVVKKCRCCCSAHCKVQFHNMYGSRAYQHKLVDIKEFELSWMDEDMDLEETFLEEEEELFDPDNLTAYLMSVAASLY